MEKILKNTGADKKKDDHFEIVRKSVRKPTHDVEFLKKQLRDKNKNTQ